MNKDYACRSGGEFLSMEREFISTDIFNNKWQELGQTDDDRRDLENMLMNNPDAGDMIPSFMKKSIYWQFYQRQIKRT